MNQKQIEARLKRLAGASPKAREYMEKANSTAVWTAKCRVCGLELHGTPAELMAHKHEG